MLPKKNRFSLKRDLKTIRKQGKLLKTPYFNLLYSVKKNREHPLFAVVAGLKVSKKAVNRNKIKRQIHEIIQIKIGKINKGINIIFFLKKPSLELKSEELISIINNHLEEINKLSKEYV